VRDERGKVRRRMRCARTFLHRPRSRFLSFLELRFPAECGIPATLWSRSSSGSLAIFAAIRRAFEDEPGDVLPRTLFERI
jgi:hypothetical protein